MSNMSTETTPSTETTENDYIKIIKDSNLSNGFFKYLFNLEEETDKGLKEEIQQNLVNPFQNVFHQQPSEIQREAEIEIKSNIKKKQKLYVCEYENCGKTYRSKENLNLHIQNIHQKLKPYQCSFCPMKFSHRNGRIYHERKVHTQNLPYQCKYDGCNHVFPCKSAMMAHVRSAHLHIKRKKYQKAQQ